MITQSLTRRLQQAYFAVAYNTTATVNAMLVLGALTPYLIYLDWQDQLAARDITLSLAVTLLSVYCYNLIYVVNDFIDRHKDKAKGIPKYSARHVFGPRRYLYVYGAVFAVIMTLTALTLPQLAGPLLVYSAGLCLLSAVHSLWQRGKILTIFLERLAKFTAPFWLLYIATNTPEAGTFLAAALLLYPVGYTLDYAYRGYLRDRLHLPTRLRFLVYAAYWTAVLVLFSLHPNYFWLSQAGDLIFFYAALYLAFAAVAELLSHWVSFQFLRRYRPHEAREKRRLLSYGIAQSVIAATGLLYALFT